MFDSFSSAPIYPGRVALALGGLIALAAVLQALI